jgi:hypothetical protein
VGSKDARVHWAQSISVTMILWKRLVLTSSISGCRVTADKTKFWTRMARVVSTNLKMPIYHHFISKVLMEHFYLLKTKAKTFHHVNVQSRNWLITVLVKTSTAWIIKNLRHVERKATCKSPIPKSSWIFLRTSKTSKRIFVNCKTLPRMTKTT